MSGESRLKTEIANAGAGGDILKGVALKAGLNRYVVKAVEEKTWNEEVGPQVCLWLEPGVWLPLTITRKRELAQFIEDYPDVVGKTVVVTPKPTRTPDGTPATGISIVAVE